MSPWPCSLLCAAMHLMPALRQTLADAPRAPRVLAPCCQSGLERSRTRCLRQPSTSSWTASMWRGAFKNSGPTRAGDVYNVSRCAFSSRLCVSRRSDIPSAHGLQRGHCERCMHAAHVSDVVQWPRASVYDVSISYASNRNGCYATDRPAAAAANSTQVYLSVGGKGLTLSPGKINGLADTPRIARTNIMARW